MRWEWLPFVSGLFACNVLEGLGIGRRGEEIGGFWIWRSSWHQEVKVTQQLAQLVFLLRKRADD